MVHHIDGSRIERRAGPERVRRSLRDRPHEHDAVLVLHRQPDMVCIGHADQVGRAVDQAGNHVARRGPVHDFLAVGETVSGKREDVDRHLLRAGVERQDAVPALPLEPVRMAGDRVAKRHETAGIRADQELEVIDVQHLDRVRRSGVQAADRLRHAARAVRQGTIRHAVAVLERMAVQADRVRRRLDRRGGEKRQVPGELARHGDRGIDVVGHQVARLEAVRRNANRLGQAIDIAGGVKAADGGAIVEHENVLRARAGTQQRDGGHGHGLVIRVVPHRAGTIQG